MKSQIRISKFLADCGECSRRNAEELILDKKVKINGKIVTDMSATVTPGVDRVHIGSRLVRQDPAGVIYFYKPRGVVSTLSDPEGRPSISDYLTKRYRSYVTVGRLDYDSSGLMILTNDGDLANLLLHPRYGFLRIYEVKVRGAVEERLLTRLRRGVQLEDGKAKAVEIEITEAAENYTRLEIVVGEGKNRMVRKMFDSIGHPIVKLKRIQHGPVKLGKLQSGEMKNLSDKEYQTLKETVERIAKKNSEEPRGRPNLPVLQKKYISKNPKKRLVRRSKNVRWREK